DPAVQGLVLKESYLGHEHALAGRVCLLRGGCLRRDPSGPDGNYP
ncbi:hypothetical protein AK812_SmicGene48061, partial [Symbiodinium microadriaticum]